MPLTDGSNALARSQDGRDSQPGPAVAAVGPPAVLRASDYVDPTHFAAEGVLIVDLDPDSTALGTVYRVPVVDPGTGTSYGTVIRTEAEVVSAVNPAAVLTATPTEVAARRRVWDRYRTILTDPGWPANSWATSLSYFATATNTLGVNGARATIALSNFIQSNYTTTTFQTTTAFAQGLQQLSNTVTANVFGVRAVTEVDRRRWARQKRQRARAAVRARELLAEHLTPEESAQLATDGYFVVTGESGRRYRIYRGYSRNIVELDRRGRPIARLCAHPSSALPDEDHMLAQRVYLQAAEADFRRIANISRIYKVEADLLLGGAEQAAADGAETTDDYAAERAAADEALRDTRRHLAA